MFAPDDSWSVIVHGGARSIAESDRALFEQGCRKAVETAAAILGTGGAALDAAETAVRVLEDLPQFNAGTGSVANEDGEVEMDAAIMDGETLAIGAVTAIREIRNPICVARALLDDRTVLLAGAGAQRFAVDIGAPSGSASPGEDPKAADTVGCVARDRLGHFAAAGSTGGIMGKRAGRVGDTPLPGCGFYADDLMGAAALSGDGEYIMRAMLAGRALHMLDEAAPAVAAERAIDLLARIGGQAGMVLLGRDGRMGLAHNSEQFAVGLAASWLGGPHAGIHLDDLREWLA